MGIGGTVMDLVKGKYINRCWLGNLDEECSREDLFDVFNEFFKLKEVNMYEDVERECNFLK